MSESMSTGVTMSGLDPNVQLCTVFGVCRSGTTAIEKLLTLSGTPTYHQPIKSSLQRGLSHIDLAACKQPDSKTSGRVAIKETLGPYEAADWTFNPLTTILDSAHPRDRLHTVITVKEPFKNFLSWMKMANVAPPKTRAPLETEELLGNFILASQTLSDMFAQSQEAGVRTTVFDYESLRTRPSIEVTHGLLRSLGIDPGVYTEEAWASMESIDSSNSGIIYAFPRPDNKLHDRLDASGAFQYFAPDKQVLPADRHAEVQTELHQAGIYDTYQQMIQYAAAPR